MQNYNKEVIAYTRGLGKLFYTLKGYGPCHNAQEVIESIGYDSENDLENPTGSIFCTHGESFLVKWDQVKNYMHVESCLKNRDGLLEETDSNFPLYTQERQISLEEIEQIFKSTFYANQGKKTIWKKRKAIQESNYKHVTNASMQKEAKEEYLLVDGYNIIYAWPELKELAEENMDAARMKLLDSLSNYQGIQKCKIITKK